MGNNKKKQLKNSPQSTVNSPQKKGKISQPKAESPKKSPKIWLYLVLIVALTAIVYSNSIKNDFANWDDDEQIIKNNDIKELNFTNVKKYFNGFYVGMYQPLTSLSFAIEYHIFGQQAKPFHIDNLILHLLNVIFVFFFIYALTKKINIAGIVALIFGIHPMHVESVSWITERKDVLYSIFFITGLISYLSFLKRRKIGYLFLSLLLFIISCFTKSAAVSFPLVIILLDYYYNVKYKLPDIIKRIPFFLVSITFGIVSIYSQKSSGAIADLTPTFSIIDRIFLACYSATFYILKLFVPTGLCAMHYFPVKHGGLLPFEYYLTALFIAALVLFMIYYKSARYKKEIIFGILFFTANIVLILQLLPVGFAITAERYTYIPYIGLLLPLAKFADSAIEDKKEKIYKFKPLILLLLAGFTLFFSFATYSRNAKWENGIVLFTDVIEKNPESFHGYWIRGSAFSNKKDYISAISDFDEALIKKAPNPAEILNNRGDAKNNIGDSLKNRGDAKRSIEYYKEALSDLNQAIKLKPNLPEAFCNRGNARDNLGDFKGAIEDNDKALSLKPDMITAIINKGVTYGKMNLLTESVKQFNKAIEINPNDASAYLNRGNARGLLKDFRGSIADYDMCLKLKPKESGAYFNRAISKISIKDTAGACEDWRKALELGNYAAKDAIARSCGRY